MEWIQGKLGELWEYLKGKSVYVIIYSIARWLIYSTEGGFAAIVVSAIISCVVSDVASIPINYLVNKLYGPIHTFLSSCPIFPSNLVFALDVMIPSLIGGIAGALAFGTTLGKRGYAIFR